MEWEYYSILEPFDRSERMFDWRFAQMAKMMFDSTQRLVDIILAAQGAKNRPKFIDTDLKDFVLTWSDPEDSMPKTPKRRQTVEEQWDIVRLIYSAYEHENNKRAS